MPHVPAKDPSVNLALKAVFARKEKCWIKTENASPLLRAAVFTKERSIRQGSLLWYHRDKTTLRNSLDSFSEHYSLFYSLFQSNSFHTDKTFFSLSLTAFGQLQRTLQLLFLCYRGNALPQLLLRTEPNVPED